MSLRVILIFMFFVIAGCDSNRSETPPLLSEQKQITLLEVWGGTVIETCAQNGYNVGKVTIAPAHLLTPNSELSLLAKTINDRLPRYSSNNIFERVEFNWLDKPMGAMVPCRKLPNTGEKWRIICTTEIDGGKWIHSATLEEASQQKKEFDTILQPN